MKIPKQETEIKSLQINSTQNYTERKLNRINFKRIEEVRHSNIKSGINPSKVGKKEVYENSVDKKEVKTPLTLLHFKSRKQLQVTPDSETIEKRNQTNERQEIQLI